METFRKQELKEHLPVVLMEIDYELLTLYEALQADDTIQIIKSKEKLTHLRLKKLEIEKG